VTESLSHPDLELLRPSVSGSAVNRSDLVSTVATEGVKRDNCAVVASGSAVDSVSAAGEVSVVVTPVESGAGKEDLSIDSGQRVPLQTSGPLNIDCRVPLPSISVARGKDTLTTQLETRNLSTVKEEPVTLFVDSVAGPMNPSAASSGAGAGEPLTTIDSGKVDQATPFVNGPTVSTVGTPNHSILSSQTSIPVESTVKTPKAAGAGRGTKQQATVLAVDTQIPANAGRGIGRGNNISLHNRPQAPPSPAALSPAAATAGDVEEEVTSQNYFGL
jgi:hypothetical protein